MTLVFFKQDIKGGLVDSEFMGKSDLKKLLEKFPVSKQKPERIDIDKFTNTSGIDLIPMYPDSIVDREIGQSIYTFSVFEFNENMDEVVFGFENRCAGLCGYGYFVYAQKIDGVWRVKNLDMAWIS